MRDEPQQEQIGASRDGKRNDGRIHHGHAKDAEGPEMDEPTKDTGVFAVVRAGANSQN